MLTLFEIPECRSTHYLYLYISNSHQLLQAGILWMVKDRKKLCLLLPMGCLLTLTPSPVLSCLHEQTLNIGCKIPMEPNLFPQQSFRFDDVLMLFIRYTEYFPLT